MAHEGLLRQAPGGSQPNPSVRQAGLADRGRQALAGGSCMSAAQIFALADMQGLRTLRLLAEPAPGFFDQYNNPKK